MHRSTEKRSVRIWGFVLAVAMMATAGTLIGSCVFDTKTSFCEQFGLRCKEGQECAANQAVCVDVGGCGNGFKDPGEVCDDGNIVDGEMGDNGVLIVDQCSHDCKSTQVCGNEIQDRGEDCDHGDLNGTPDNACDSNCHLVSMVCGNGMIDKDKGEQCDPGDTDSTTCNSHQADQIKMGLGCQISKCNDGYTNVAAGETCDSAGTDTAQCVGQTCKISICGDSYVNAAAGEDCETKSDTSTCNGSAAGLVSCHSAKCGDGYLNKKAIPGGQSSVEACDPPGGIDTMACNGNNNGQDGPGSCQFPKCGDGYANSATGEQCDLGGSDSPTCNGNSMAAKNANVQCKLAQCGDGYQNNMAGEECETTVDGAMCNGPGAGNVSCHVSKCGDGHTNMAAMEDCDNGSMDTMTCNGASTGSANVNCKLPTCGDTYQNSMAGEGCDKGNTDTSLCNGSNAGSASCQIPTCGDGHVNTHFQPLLALRNEECDPGAAGVPGVPCSDPKKACMNCNCM
jgi:hypothetical protein